MKILISYAGWLALIFGLSALFVYIIVPDKKVITFTLAGLCLVNTIIFCIVDWTNLRCFLRSRSAAYGTNSVILTIVFTGVLIFINLLAYRHSHRIDLTEEGIYTLSSQTRKIVSTLPREIKLTAFFRTDSPEKTEFKLNNALDLMFLKNIFDSCTTPPFMYK